MVLMRTNVWLVLFVTLSIYSCSLIIDVPARPSRCEPNDENDPCGSGYSCVPTSEGYRCRAIECASDEDCSDSFFCLDGTCIAKQCQENGDCSDDLICVNNLCVDGQCAESSECELGYYCDGHLCTRGCDSSDRCPESQICVENLCRTPRVELCNGIDDDFDGHVDEDLNRDGDGYSSCETISTPPDCNDNDPQVYPGATERCDGADNDCNGYIDDNACSLDEVCVPFADNGECLPRSADMCEGDAQCPDPDFPFCDTSTGLCMPSVGMGDGCFRDDQCEEGTCVRTDALGRSGRYCLDLCCGSGCDSGYWCIDNGTGLRVCAPNDWYPDRTVTCLDRGFLIEECETCWTFNSGRRQVCRTSCCRDSDCRPVSGRCQLVTGKTSLATGISLLVCNAYVNTYDRFEPCPPDYPDLCDSGFYFQRGSNCHCASPCCENADCRVAGHDRAICALSSIGWTICYDPEQLGELGSGAMGDTCTPGSGIEQCATGTCHPNGYCTRPCCPGDTCTRSMACHPASLGGGRYANLCTRIDM